MWVVSGALHRYWRVSGVTMFVNLFEMWPFSVLIKTGSAPISLEMSQLDTAVSLRDTNLYAIWRDRRVLRWSDPRRNAGWWWRSVALLTFRWDAYCSRYLQFVLLLLELTYYNFLYIRVYPDDIQRMINFAIFKFAILAIVQFMNYGTEWVAPNYNYGSSRIDHVEGSMLSCLPFHLVIVLSHSCFCRIAEKVHMDHMRTDLSFHRMNEVDWASSEGSEEYLAYDLITSTVCSYSAEGPAPVDRQMVDYGPAVPVSSSAVDVD